MKFSIKKTNSYEDYTPITPKIIKANEGENFLIAIALNSIVEPPLYLCVPLYIGRGIPKLDEIGLTEVWMKGYHDFDLPIVLEND